MAIRPRDVYPSQTVPADANYPHGSAQNITTPSDGTGTPWEKTLINDLFGFEQALLAEGGITPSGSPDTAVASQYLAGVKAAALAAEYTPLSGPAISISGFLDRQGLWAEDEAGIQAANAYLVGAAKHDMIRLPPKSTIAITSGLSINATFAGIAGNGASLNGAGLGAGGKVLDIIGTGVPGADRGVFEDLVIEGSGAAGTVTGIDLRNASYPGNGPSKVVLRNVHIGLCGYGVRTGSARFAAMLEAATLATCGVAVEASGGSPVLLLAPKFYGNTQIFSLADASAVVAAFGAVASSNAKIADLIGGILDLHGCAFQDTAYTVTPFTLANQGTRVRMSGGLLQLSVAPMSYWVNAGAGAAFVADGVKFSGARTTTGAFATGAGAVTVRNAVYEDPADICTVLNASRSWQLDGGFEEASIVDDIFITREAVSITARYSVGNTVLSIDGSPPFAAHGGSQVLKYFKNSASAANSAFALVCIPVRAHERPSGEFYWRRIVLGSTSGDILFRYRFVRLGFNGSGIPEIVRGEQVGSTTVTDGVSDSSWVKETLPDDLTAPEWATHFIVEVDGYSWLNVALDAIWFDDVNVSLLG